MPIVNGEEVIPITANQFDEFIFNSKFGNVNFSALQPTITPLFSSQTIAASATTDPSTKVHTGNNVKMVVTFSQTGISNDCTMHLYGSSHEDLSEAYLIMDLNLGSGDDPAWMYIDTLAIPEYSYCTVENSGTSSAIATVEITTWKETA